MIYPEHVYGPIPSNCDRNTVEGFAEAAAKRFGFQPDQNEANPPQTDGNARSLRIQDLIKKLGGQILFEPALVNELHTSQSLIVFNDDRFDIALPNQFRLKDQEQNWALAQELGHLLLHYPLLKASCGQVAMAAKRYPDQSCPIARQARFEAIWFAFGFLTPAKPFMEAYRATSKPSSLVYRFNVPSRVIELRHQYLIKNACP